MLILVVVMVYGLTAEAINAQDGASVATPPSITTIPSDGFNLKVVEQPTPYYIITTLDPPVFNWFAGTFTNLPTDKEVTIGLNMNGMDQNINKANVSKWAQLKTVMTYADPTQYATYEWFQKDEHGRWVSGDPLKQGKAKYAGTGVLPEQHVIPKEVAEQFLSGDGNYWQAWREVDQTVAVESLNIFRIKQRFALPQASIAMRVPYTYTYLQQFLAGLEQAKYPDVCIDVIGETPEKRKLQAIRLSRAPDTTDLAARQTVLLVGREHANEAYSSWMVHNVIAAWLTSREDPTFEPATDWILIPIQDPDGSAHGNYNRQTNLFDPEKKELAAEALAYANYFIDYVNGGRSLDLCITLHNVEAGECPNIFCPVLSPLPYELEPETKLNTAVFTNLKEHGLLTGDPMTCWEKLLVQSRLTIWCNRRFGGLPVGYEVNDRYPERRLNLRQAMEMGALFVQSVDAWENSEDGRQWHARIRKVVQRRALERKSYFELHRLTPNERTTYEILIKGF